MPNYRAEEPLDRVFHALGDSTRRQMITRLIRSPASVTDLARPFELSLPSVMQHLKVLEDSGLVATSKLGRTRTCAIKPEGLRIAERWLTAQRTVWEQRLDRLGDVLGESGRKPARRNASKPQP